MFTVIWLHILKMKELLEMSIIFLGISLLRSNKIVYLADSISDLGVAGLGGENGIDWICIPIGILVEGAGRGCKINLPGR